jgi:hypothetical protein
VALEPHTLNCETFSPPPFLSHQKAAAHPLALSPMHRDRSRPHVLLADCRRTSLTKLWSGLCDAMLCYAMLCCAGIYSNHQVDKRGNLTLAGFLSCVYEQTVENEAAIVWELQQLGYGSREAGSAPPASAPAPAPEAAPAAAEEPPVDPTPAAASMQTPLVVAAPAPAPEPLPATDTAATRSKTKSALLGGLRSGALEAAVTKMEEDEAAAAGEEEEAEEEEEEEQAGPGPATSDAVETTSVDPPPPAAAAAPEEQGEEEEAEDDNEEEEDDEEFAGSDDDAFGFDRGSDDGYEF